MAGYGDFNDGFIPGGVADPFPADGSNHDNDPNDDFDPFELLQSPIFNENRGGRGSVTTGGGGGGDQAVVAPDHDYGGLSESMRQQQQRMQQQQQMAQAQAQMDNSQASQHSQHQKTPFSGPQNNYGGQAQGGAGFPNQFGGGIPGNQVPPNMQGMNGSGRNNNGMPNNMAAMNNNFAMQQQQQGNNQGMGGGNPMGGGGMNQGMNPGMNSAALNQMGQLQGMQQALQMRQGMQGNVNPMQGNMNPAMMNNMAGGGMPNMGGNMNNMNPNAGGMQGMGQGMPNNVMGAGGGGMNPNAGNRNGSLNTAVSNLGGNMMQQQQNGNMHASMPNINFPQARGGSLPTSPNAVPSIAQMSASIRAGNSSRSGGRTRGPTPKVDVNGKVIANTSSDPGINEAMEKLCESMRRSAMSRNLVKQLSGRSVQRQGSARSLSRSNSGVGMRKQIPRSLSGGMVRGDDGSGRGTPTRTAPIRRLSNSKHRLHQRAAPGVRGPFRTNSMGSQASMGSQGQTFLQLDDQSLGAL